MPILGILASSVPAAAGDYESIATVTVGAGGSTSIDFTSISGTYTHLQLRYIARVTDNVNAFDINFIRFNSDTGSNYSYHYLTGTGSAVNAGAGTSQTSTWGGLWPYNGTTASTYGAGVIDILDYANTNKYKTIRVLSGADANGSGECFINSGLWMSTSAITSINIKPVGTKTYSQFSHFALYGIKSA
jgi:hypothetical protein